ncbi:50S ribosomal protein L14 [Candidatus Woesearchaeota archaeon]|nr:50S ribosomal protein L14 [Candidatus Woesearchaeota archaeon]MBW2978541.1 50S ribosomal protein L14 [Candidatus Woesearchaeota archaeon]
MKALNANIGRVLPHMARIPVCDNSGARILKVISVIGHKTRKGRASAAGIGDKIMASVISGKPDIRKQVVAAVIVRQKKEFKRPNGMRVKFEDNAAVVIKDDLGNPKGTMIKGPIAKEVAVRWPNVSKIASIII